MTTTEIAILAGVAGVAVGFAVGYVVVKRACKDRIVGGVEAGVKALGGGSTVQQLAGQLARGLVEASG